MLLFLIGILVKDEKRAVEFGENVTTVVEVQEDVSKIPEPVDVEAEIAVASEENAVPQEAPVQNPQPQVQPQMPPQSAPRGIPQPGLFADSLSEPDHRCGICL